jgi:hypothetical protein
VTSVPNLLGRTTVENTSLRAQPTKKVSQIQNFRQTPQKLRKPCSGGVQASRRGEVQTIAYAVQSIERPDRSQRTRRRSNGRAEKLRLSPQSGRLGFERPRGDEATCKRPEPGIPLAGGAHSQGPTTSWQDHSGINLVCGDPVEKYQDSLALVSREARRDTGPESAVFLH